MNVAILGWGSLIWDPRDLKLTSDVWHPDGPHLPVEFVHISDASTLAPRLTLVLYEASWVQNVLTLWNLSPIDDLDSARRNLAKREGITTADPLDRIAYVKAGPEPLDQRSQLTSITTAPKRRVVLGQIDAWLSVHGFGAAIWTDLAYTAELGQQDAQGVRGLPTENDAALWLHELVKAGRAKSAEEYLRRAPAQVRTLVRERAERDFGWSPRPIASPIRSADDPRYKEWEQCRTTIGRLDNNLQDIRKYGFALISGLLSASAFLGLLGTQTFGASAPALQMRVGVIAVIVFLIAALFSVDRYYEILLSGATERAMDLEVQTNPPLRVTKYLSFNATRTRSPLVTFVLYLSLLAIAFGLGALMVLRASDVAAQTGATFEAVSVAASRQDEHDHTAASAAAAASAQRDLIAAEDEQSVLPGVQLGLAACFLLAWFYVVLYWYWSRLQIGPRSDKIGRVWPEGPKKVAAPEI
jgi:hypothetical protein